jgi:hypothetical protein
MLLEALTPVHPVCILLQLLPLPACRIWACLVIVGVVRVLI